MDMVGWMDRYIGECLVSGGAMMHKDLRCKCSSFAAKLTVLQHWA